MRYTIFIFLALLQCATAKENRRIERRGAFPDGTSYHLVAVIGTPAKAQRQSFSLHWGWWGKSWPAEPDASEEIPTNALLSLEFTFAGRRVHLPQKLVTDLCEVKDIDIAPSKSGAGAEISITGSDGGEAYRASLIVVGSFLRERVLQSAVTPVSERTILKWNE